MTDSTFKQGLTYSFTPVIFCNCEGWNIAWCRFKDNKSDKFFSFISSQYVQIVDSAFQWSPVICHEGWKSNQAVWLRQFLNPMGVCDMRYGLLAIQEQYRSVWQSSSWNFSVFQSLICDIFYCFVIVLQNFQYILPNSLLIYQFEAESEYFWVRCNPRNEGTVPVPVS